MSINYMTSIMTKYAVSLPLLFLFILSGCAQKGPGDKYLKQISTSINKDYNLRKGELIAKYSLLDKPANNKCLFNKDYGLIVSDGSASQRFLNSLRMHLKDTNILQATSKPKIKALYNNAIAINSKYNVISKKDLKKLESLTALSEFEGAKSPFDLLSSKSKKLSVNYFENLGYIDNFLRYMPIFLPQTRTTITSPFGNRRHPIYGEKRYHQGVDFVSHKHSMIHAAADGKVLKVARSKSYGNFILIEHGGIFQTRYAHLSKLLIDSGEEIFRGELIGLQGSSGDATGDHLHFEVIYKGAPVDPMFFVGPEYYCRK